MGYIISNVGGQNGGERAKEKYSVFSVVNEPSSITYSNPIHQDARLTSAPSSEISTKGNFSLVTQADYLSAFILYLFLLIQNWFQMINLKDKF